MTPKIQTPCFRNRIISKIFRLASMKLVFQHFFIFYFLFFIFQSCGLDIEDPTPPPKPHWVQKSFPEEWPERGIDAHESEGIFLEWELIENQGVVAYLLYRAELNEENDSLGNYELLTRQETGLNNDSSYLDPDTRSRIRYYYKLRAEDSSNNLSRYSDSITYSKLPTISINLMSPNSATATLNTKRQLSWGYSYHLEMEDYCITITTQTNELIIRDVLSPTNYVGGTEYWTIPDSISLEDNHLYKWRVDVVAGYVNDLETAGSESMWATFLYIGD